MTVSVAQDKSLSSDADPMLTLVGTAIHLVATLFATQSPTNFRRTLLLTREDEEERGQGGTDEKISYFDLFHANWNLSRNRDRVQALILRGSDKSSGARLQ